MELTTIEKEMFKIITGHEYSNNLGMAWNASLNSAKAAAALCEKKMREAIDLAREESEFDISDKRIWSYTKEEIIKLLTEQK